MVKTIEQTAIEDALAGKEPKYPNPGYWHGSMGIENSIYLYAYNDGKRVKAGERATLDSSREALRKIQ